MKRIIPLVEVSVVIALFLSLLLSLRGTAFGQWQQTTFGAAPLSSTLLFFLVPLIFLFTGRKNLGQYGLAVSELRYHLQVGLRATGVLLPAAVIFPLMGLIGTTHEEWLGALILAAGITVSCVFAVKRTINLETRHPRMITPAGVGSYLAIIALSLLACFALNTISGTLARVVHTLVFVAFMEEFFFRGYLQGRLNDAFGRPFHIAGVDMGVGLLLSATCFGLLHPLSSIDSMPWPWAVWTGVGGLLFGYLREKTGSVVAPTVAHGLFILPTAFFGT